MSSDGVNECRRALLGMGGARPRRARTPGVLRGHRDDRDVAEVRPPSLIAIRSRVRAGLSLVYGDVPARMGRLACGPPQPYSPVRWNYLVALRPPCPGSN